ncbi:MAG: NUDIX hydrolase [Thermoleophilia bacterium]|nr:NUDIX hydrolase [Thermoleophilia bacterium]
MSEIVPAAGGVPVRDGAAGVEVLVVHRARYADWTFPKGKRHRSESDEECALREVAEETGLVCALEHELPVTVYTDALGRPKRVRWWRMLVASGELAPRPGEIDDARWVSLEEAAALLTHERDVALLRRL